MVGAGRMALACVLACWPAVGAAQPLARYAFSHTQMGTAFRIICYAPSPAQAAQAASAAFARIDTLNQRLSDYLHDSEVNRLAAGYVVGEWVAISPDLYAVLYEAQTYARVSAGRFDVTVGPATRLWRWAQRRGQHPPEDRRQAALDAVGYQHLALHPESHQLRLLQPGMRLDLGGIAKGYAADEALRVLRQHGLAHALVDAGGDLVAGAPPPDSLGWRIALEGVGVRYLAHGAVATSGDTYRFVEIDGVRYSHLVDPQRGLGLTHRMQVTVAAATATAADALASTLSVVGPDDALNFLKTHAPDASALLLFPEGTTPRQRGALRLPPRDANRLLHPH